MGLSPAYPGTPRRLRRAAAREQDGNRRRSQMGHSPLNEVNIDALLGIRESTKESCHVNWATAQTCVNTSTLGHRRLRATWAAANSGARGALSRAGQPLGTHATGVLPLESRRDWPTSRVP